MGLLDLAKSTPTPPDPEGVPGYEFNELHEVNRATPTLIPLDDAFIRRVHAREWGCRPRDVRVWDPCALARHVETVSRYLARRP